MHHRIRPIWDVPESKHTPLEVYRDRKQHRREFLKRMGISGVAASLPWLAAGCGEADEKDVVDANRVEIPLQNSGQQATDSAANGDEAGASNITEGPFAGCDAALHPRVAWPQSRRLRERQKQGQNCCLRK